MSAHTKGDKLLRAKPLVVVTVVSALLALSCGGRDNEPVGADNGATEPTTSEVAGGGGNNGVDCSTETPAATEVGVTEDTITIEVMADVGSSVAPGLFQGNHDALKAFEKYVNDNGGIACRNLEVKLWDTKLDADESLNGQIDACKNSLALVGSNALFNPDVSTMANCEDSAGEPTGLPDIAALANDINERCNDTTYLIQGVSDNCDVLTGERPLTAFTGFTDYLLEQNDDDLHGMFMVPGDLPTTVVSATYQINAAEQAGVVWDDVVRVSGRAEQAAFTPFVQMLKANDSNYVYNGSNDRAMTAMRKETAAQGGTSVDVWGCSLGCYTPQLPRNGRQRCRGHVCVDAVPPLRGGRHEPCAAGIRRLGRDRQRRFVRCPGVAGRHVVPTSHQRHRGDRRDQRDHPGADARGSRGDR